jgi:hypothetical protein
MIKNIEAYHKLKASNFVEIICNHCKTTIKRRKQHVKIDKNHYCNNSCQAQRKRKEAREKILDKGSKKCSLCGLEKPLNHYNKNKGTPDGFNRVCKSCSKKRSKQYYSENSSLHKKNVNDRNQRVRIEQRREIFEFHKKNPCVDCGNNNPVVLDFDHKDGVIKKHNISEMIGTYSWANILNEIEKCEVRCANCHRIRTAKQQGWYKNLLHT